MNKNNKKEKKKILIFHHSDAWGGGGISLKNTIRMLKNIYNVIVCLPHENSVLSEEIKREGIKVITVNDNIGLIDTFSGGPPTFSKAFAVCFIKIIVHTYWKYRKIIKEEAPDMVAVNSMTLSWVGRELKQRKIPSLCFVRETYVKEPGMKIIKFCLDSYFDGVAYISEFDRKEFNTKTCYQEVIEDTVLPEEFINEYVVAELLDKYKLDNKFYVLFLGGTNDILKGWEVIREAMNKIENSNIVLLVAGQIEPEKQIIMENIIYLGINQNIEELYAICSVVVFPATFPHQARPVFEAGFMKKPVIVSEYPNIVEFVRDGYNGLVFTSGDCEALASRILLLYETPDLRIKLGNHNYHLAAERHSYTKCAEKLNTLIEEIFNERAGSVNGQKKHG